MTHPFGVWSLDLLKVQCRLHNNNLSSSPTWTFPTSHPRPPRRKSLLSPPFKLFNISQNMTFKGSDWAGSVPSWKIQLKVTSLLLFSFFCLDFAQVAKVQHRVANIQVHITNNKTEKFNVESHFSTWAPCCYALSMTINIEVQFKLILNSIWI